MVHTLRSRPSVSKPSIHPHRQHKRDPSPSGTATATTSSYSTRQSTPEQQPNGTMFSTRKYTPLPTSANGTASGSRKRSGGGMTAWKRYILVGGGLILVVLAFGGYHGVGRSNGEDLVFEEDSE